MDDFPAVPASPGPRRHRLTVVIPVRDGEHHLGRCLRRLRETNRIEYELIVVDDGSADGSARLALEFGARLIRHDRPLGPAAARNDGAVAASAPLIFFLDADVAVHPDTMARVLGHFDADPDLAALFGSYDDQPDDPGLVSRFRNLLHHHVHQRGHFEGDARPARTFWTGCGAIRKDVFLAQGGFDPGRYRRPAIEDIELGYRVSRSGGRIILARDVLATHLKRWSFADMVRTDIFRRGVPWMLLMLRSRVAETDLNVDRDGRLSVAATGLAGLSVLLAPAWPLLGVVALACLALIAWRNREFYRFLAGQGGPGFAAACFPLHLVYFGCCGLSVLIALALWHGRLRREEARTAGEAVARGHRVDEAAPARPASTKRRRSIRWPK